MPDEEKPMTPKEAALLERVAKGLEELVAKGLEELDDAVARLTGEKPTPGEVKPMRVLQALFGYDVTAPGDKIVLDGPEEPSGRIGFSLYGPDGKTKRCGVTPAVTVVPEAPFKPDDSPALIAMTSKRKRDVGLKRWRVTCGGRRMDEPVEVLAEDENDALMLALDATCQRARGSVQPVERWDGSADDSDLIDRFAGFLPNHVEGGAHCFTFYVTEVKDVRTPQ